MNISEETNLDKLQSLAYEQILISNNAQHNLQMLEARINELKQAKIEEEVLEDE